MKINKDNYFLYFSQNVRRKWKCASLCSWRLWMRYVWPAVQNPKIFSFHWQRTKKTSKYLHFTSWNQRKFDKKKLGKQSPIYYYFIRSTDRLPIMSALNKCSVVFPSFMHLFIFCHITGHTEDLRTMIDWPQISGSTGMRILLSFPIASGLKQLNMSCARRGVCARVCVRLVR